MICINMVLLSHYFVVQHPNIIYQLVMKDIPEFIPVAGLESRHSAGWPRSNTD